MLFAKIRFEQAQSQDNPGIRGLPRPNALYAGYDTDSYISLQQLLHPYDAFGFLVPYFDLEVIRFPTPPYTMLMTEIPRIAREPYQIQCSSNQMVLHTRAILRPSASHHHDRMLLDIVTCYQYQLLFPYTRMHRDQANAPSPGMYAVTTFPLLNLTLAIFLSPELGFFGFVVPTFKHTAFNSGLPASCGDRSFRAFCAVRPFRSTWIRVHFCAREAGRGWKVGALGSELAIDGRSG